jgi:hypothetical protein
VVLLFPKLSDDEEETVTVAVLPLLLAPGDIVKVLMLVGDDVIKVRMSFNDSADLRPG